MVISITNTYLLPNIKHLIGIIYAAFQFNRKNSPRLCLRCLKIFRQLSQGSSCGGLNDLRRSGSDCLQMKERASGGRTVVWLPPAYAFSHLSTISPLFEFVRSPRILVSFFFNEKRKIQLISE